MSPAREVTVELEARPGPWHIGPHYRPLDGWLYNGDAPGPLIEARLGDTLVVRLTNALPRPTSFALSGPPTRRYTSESRAGMQEPIIVRPHRMVPPNGTVEYRFPLTHAGTFWYHPAGAVMQIERGLHGVLIVRPAAVAPASAERVIVLDDVCLDRHAASHRHLRSAGMGNVLLMNGRVQPQLVMSAATLEHWRVINVAHARPVRFSLGGAPFRCADQTWRADSDHLDDMPEVSEMMLEAGGTMDVVVGPFEAGMVVHVQSLPHRAESDSRTLAPVFGAVRISV
ncbi:MAG TPA: multicopper oxidase domain-containing protein [Longimicrobiales bacterium]|nr:multicopper oxidase domain-containing protein [Longimicrobiales bacterium]